MLLPYHNLRMNHWNPGAKQPLVLPIQVICNTDDEVLYDQIRQNSRLPNKTWIKVSPAHEGVAIICGSGPSVADHIEDIRVRANNGGTIFALNGCANFLNKHGIIPDYQVILDARKETADLIGDARTHLFASQVHPECFKRAPDAVIWHLQLDNIDDLLPDYNEDCALIGGAGSVGNTSLCLVYAMGYRTLKVYGLDSSHRGDKGHAFNQKMNDGDPCAYVDFNGKTYLVSLTMKLQAEKFQTTSADLKALGASIEVFGDGLLPDMYRNPHKVSELDKYTSMWNHPEYRNTSPGEQVAGEFLKMLQGRPHGQIIDFGCGTGRAALRFKDNGYPVMLIDFTENSRDPEAQMLPFIQADITLPLQAWAPYGFCADVMEHLAPEQVQSAIHNIMTAAQTTFFQISTVHDEMGALEGHTLHLTVRSHDWWGKLIASMGYNITWEENRGNASLFLVERF